MKRASLCLLMLLTGVLSGWSQEAAKETTKEAPKKTEDARPISAIGWLVGGVWTADASKMSPGMQRIETRYRWSDNNAFLQFTTHFVFDKGTAKTYDGNLFWDPEKKSLSMWYMDTRNNIIQSPIQVEGDVLRFAFRGYNFEGRMADLQVLVTRKSSDQYHWAVSENQAGTWKELAALDYVRMPGS